MDATFRSPSLDANGIVVDIGRATELLHEIVGGLSYRNLDDEPELAGLNTTTEVLARLVADRLAERIQAGAFGDLDRPPMIMITLHESHLASASYERPL